MRGWNSNVPNSSHNSAVSFQRLVRHGRLDSEIHADIVRRRKGGRGTEGRGREGRGKEGRGREGSRRDESRKEGRGRKGGERKGGMEGERDRGC